MLLSVRLSVLGLLAARRLAAEVSPTSASAEGGS